MEFITFKKFKSSQDAMYLLSVLATNDIEYQVEDIPPSIDLPTGGVEFEDKFIVKLKQKDFDIAEKLLEDDAIEEIDEVEKDYYLFEFDDDELLDIIKNFDEWSKTDYILAQKILKERGKEIPMEKVNEYKEKKLELLRQPIKVSKGWIIFGYIFAILGGIIGIFMGLSAITAKRTLPNGEVVRVYDDTTRIQGRNLFYTGLITFILSSILLIISLF